ncbi:MAG: membrane protein insertase YidC [Puniceicoccales bacterium]|nr:membrane protein insertase YidC [Puniceicoccales bacterium]
MPSGEVISVLAAMDRKSFFLGLLCLSAAFGLIYFQRAQVRPTALQPEITSTEITTQAEDFFPESPAAEAALESPTAVWDLSTPCLSLENEEIRVQIHLASAAIREVALKKYPFKKGSPEPFIFNHGAPMPALELQLGHTGERPQYELLSQDARQLRFLGRYPNGLSVERSYRLSDPDNPKEDPYVIHQQLRWENRGPRPQALQDLKLSLGQIPSSAGDLAGDFLNFGHFNGKKAFFVPHGDFSQSSGFLGFGKREARAEIRATGTIRWGSLKNQFFCSILTPSSAAAGYLFRPTESPSSEGMTGSLVFQLGQLQAQEQKSLGLEFYVGPKDFVRLDRLGLEQDRVMQFGLFGFVSKLLLLLMKAIHCLIPNWGLTIIAVTLLIRLLLWPLTRAQVRSSKQMALVQEPLKQLRERYKGQPQKLQTETLKLFKENQVNPAAGCLPVLIQIPIFLGLYGMLRTATDLRFAEFLWIRDLSRPDTLVHLGRFPLNLLPWLMSLSTFWQMRMSLAPTLDPMQRRLFQWMPLLFLFFCYNLPAGLILYWTVQNILSIIQQRRLAGEIPPHPLTRIHPASPKGKKSSSPKA